MSSKYSSMDRGSLLAVEQIDRTGGPQPPPPHAQTRSPPSTQPGVAYIDPSQTHEEQFCHCCPTFLSTAISICPIAWPLMLFGCVPVNEREEQVLLVFGKYYDTLREPGMHYVNPMGLEKRLVSAKRQNMDVGGPANSLKVADRDGNPVMVSGVVSFRVINSKAAALDVQNHVTFVHTQAQTVLKQIVSRYPYETTDGTPSLKTETYEIGLELTRTLQDKVRMPVSSRSCLSPRQHRCSSHPSGSGSPSSSWPTQVLVAGVLIETFELSDLSYAPEIAQVMLVRQQVR
jgi:regulator of protease activity HflC (stomatin/prohibitin superfamily)